MLLLVSCCVCVLVCVFVLLLASSGLTVVCVWSVSLIAVQSTVLLELFLGLQSSVMLAHNTLQSECSVLNTNEVASW
jgi:hypothetical protein